MKEQEARGRTGVGRWGQRTSTLPTESKECTDAGAIPILGHDELLAAGEANQMNTPCHTVYKGHNPIMSSTWVFDC